MSPLELPCWAVGAVAGGSGIAVGGYHLPSVACHQPSPPDWSDTSISSSEGSRRRPARRCTLGASRRQRWKGSDSSARLSLPGSCIVPLMGMRRRSRRRGLLVGAAAGAAVAHHQGNRDEEQPADQTAYAPPPADPADQIEHLAQLHASGALTDEEFASAKANVLGS